MQLKTFDKVAYLSHTEFTLNRLTRVYGMKNIYTRYANKKLVTIIEPPNQITIKEHDDSVTPLVKIALDDSGTPTLQVLAQPNLDDFDDFRYKVACYNEALIALNRLIGLSRD